MKHLTSTLSPLQLKLMKCLRLYDEDYANKFYAFVFQRQNTVALYKNLNVTVNLLFGLIYLTPRGKRKHKSYSHNPPHKAANIA